MQPYELAHQAHRILSSQTRPGIEQEALEEELHKLEGIIRRIGEPGTPEAQAAQQTVLDRVADYADRLETQIWHPSLQRMRDEPAIRHIMSGLHGTLHRLTDILSAYEMPAAKEKRFIIERRSLQQEHNLATLGLDVTDFRHIPYSYATLEDRHAQQAMALASIRQEKRYLARPLKARPSTEWNVDMVGAPKAWQLTRGEGISVGIADTGCDYNHPELHERFGEVKGYNFVTDSDDPMDDNHHGTHVAGTCAGKTVGVAPACTLYALKFLDDNGSGREVDFIRAAEWAIDEQLDILNGSFGSGYRSPAEEAICEALEGAGVWFVAAAGNDGSTGYSYPASYPTVMSVAAVDRNKRHARFSQRNDQVAISAPGVDIYSTIPGRRYLTFSGTSMATPHAAGALALLRAQESSREALMQYAEHLGDTEKYGEGLVRVDHALNQQRKAS